MLLSRQDVTDLDGWFWGDPLGRDQLGQPLKRAINSGGDVVVRENHVRISLLRILDLMDSGGLVYTAGMRRLQEVAHHPIIGS